MTDKLTPDDVADIQKRYQYHSSGDAHTICQLCDALTKERKENEAFRRGHIKPGHGRCCTCQRCGQGYDDCRCELDDACDEVAILRAAVAERTKEIELGEIKLSEQAKEIERLFDEATARDTEIEKLKADRNNLEGLVHTNERLNLKIIALSDNADREQYKLQQNIMRLEILLGKGVEREEALRKRIDDAKMLLSYWLDNSGVHPNDCQYDHHGQCQDHPEDVEGRCVGKATAEFLMRPTGA